MGVFREAIYGLRFDDERKEGTIERREEIVRCRDCKHFTYADATHGNDDWCAKHEHIGWSVNGFCAWAERKEVGE